VVAGAVSAMAQGYFNANNGGSGVLLQVQDPAINNGVAATVGTPAVTAGFADAGKASVVISMFAAANGTTLAALMQSAPISVVTNSASSVGTFQGTFAPGNPFTLPTSAAFNGSSPIEVIFFATTLDGKYTGWSAEATGFTPAVAASGAPAPAVFGATPGLINSFVITPGPEPATLAIGGLGAAALRTEKEE